MGLVDWMLVDREAGAERVDTEPSNYLRIVLRSLTPQYKAAAPALPAHGPWELLGPGLCSGRRTHQTGVFEGGVFEGGVSGVRFTWVVQMPKTPPPERWATRCFCSCTTFPLHRDKVYMYVLRSLE